MISILFGLGTAVCFAASSLLSSRAVRQIGPWSVTAWVMVFGLIITAPMLIPAGIPADLGENVGWLITAGTGNVAGILLAAAAFRIGKVGVVAPIMATEGAIAAVIAALLGESIAPIVGFFLMVIVVGIVISAIAPDPEPLENERPVLAVVLATCAAFCFGLSLYSSGAVSGELPLAWVLLPARLVGVVALAIPLALLGRLKLTRSTLPMVVAMGIIEVIGLTLFSFGAKEQIGVTSVMASQFAPIAAVMAYVLFRERLGRLQITGVVILVLAVSGLTLAN